MWENIFPLVCGKAVWYDACCRCGIWERQDRTTSAAGGGRTQDFQQFTTCTCSESKIVVQVQPFNHFLQLHPEDHRTAKLAAPMLIVEAYFFQSFFFDHFTSPGTSSSLFTLSSWMAFVLNWLTGLEYLHCYSREHSVCLHALVARSQVPVATTGIDWERDWKAR